MIIHHPGHLFANGTHIWQRIPYHHILQTILDNPPEGYSFDETKSHTSSEDINQYLRQWADKAAEFGVSQEQFNEYLKTRPPNQEIPKGFPCWTSTLSLYTHPNDWMIEIEDWCHLLWPYFGNNYKCLEDVENHYAARIIRAQFELDNFKGVVTHVKDSFNCIRGLFGDEVAAKTKYMPLGVEVPDISGKRKKGKELRILFHGSTHHTGTHFALRGGVELVEAFKVANAQNPNIKLSIVYTESLLREKGYDVDFLKNHPDIDYYGDYISRESMVNLLLNTEVLAIPGFRLHSGTCIQGMFYGSPVLASDGWGFSEYVKDGYNGLIAKGQKCSWKCEKGIMRERYTPFEPQPELIASLIEAMLTLAGDDKLYNRMSKNARQFCLENHTVANRNKHLKKIFEEGFGK
jgi:glycosyltransferase involved in cell wall biosynthesis